MSGVSGLLEGLDLCGLSVLPSLFSLSRLPDVLSSFVMSALLVSLVGSVGLVVGWFFLLYVLSLFVVKF